jgi:ribonucleoside-diphosphate reductase alpha chain
MISMDVRHPDIREFVKMKHDLTKVTGANVSVKITDDFMEAVRDGEEFTLRFPVDAETPTHISSINAVELWNDIVESATKTAL